MGCAGSSDSKPSFWKSCKECVCPEGVEPMEMPGSMGRVNMNRSSPMLSSTRSSAYAPASRATSLSASPAPGRGVLQSPHQYPSPTRSNFLLSLGSPPRSDPGDQYGLDLNQTQQHGPPHSVHCQRRRLMLHNRQRGMLLHQQQLVLVPHLHLHNLLSPHLHLHQMQATRMKHNPLAHHHPNRRSSLYYGQGYIVAHHNHHHHVNFQ
ncbi:hypothetical protein Mapa_007269 [Marchantia paleacea]|nr:hypothetical protein Mapa_007269 [Marchantia paleacea]